MQHSETVTLENPVPWSHATLTVTDNEILGPVGQVLQAEGYPVLGRSVKEQAVTARAAAAHARPHARPRASSPAAGSSGKDTVSISGSRLLWGESNAHHGPGPRSPAGQGGTPSSPGVRGVAAPEGRGSRLHAPTG